MKFDEWFNKRFPIPIPGTYDSFELQNMKMAAKEVWDVRQDEIDELVKDIGRLMTAHERGEPLNAMIKTIHHKYRYIYGWAGDL